MANLEYRVERDRSSGRFHRRYRDEYNEYTLTREQCQRDQSGSYEVMPRFGKGHYRDGVPEGTPEDALCKWDFRPAKPKAESDEEDEF